LNEEDLRHQAELLVEMHWPEIQAVATALLESSTGELDGDDATIICDTFDQGGDWREELRDLQRRRGW
jgi:hypothetical protein